MPLKTRNWSILSGDLLQQTRDKKSLLPALTPAAEQGNIEVWLIPQSESRPS